MILLAARDSVHFRSPVGPIQASGPGESSTSADDVLSANRELILAAMRGRFCYLPLVHSYLTELCKETGLEMHEIHRAIAGLPATGSVLVRQVSRRTFLILTTGTPLTTGHKAQGA
jgi:hypothetical protein